MSDINKETKDLLNRAQAISEDILEIESIDVQSAYQKVLAHRRNNAKKRGFARLVNYAAILSIPLLIMSLTFGVLYFTNKNSKEDLFAEVMASNGTIAKYELPDHSIVWLNSGSKLKYPTKFKSKSREVELDGEAFFEVQANKKSPFYVNTPNDLRLYVYGTRFNIAAYKDDNIVETVLEEGKLNVILPGSKGEYVLSPGEFLSFNNVTGETLKRQVDVYEKVAWKEGKLIFRNTSLADIFKVLERHFNCEIVFNNHSNKDYKYRATFRNESLSQILDYLAKSENLKWTVKGVDSGPDSTKKKIVINLD